MDIYRFDLYPEARPLPVTYMKGRVMDAQTLQPLGSTFDLIDLETGATAIVSFSDPVTGAFLLALPTDRDYALNVSADGHAFHSENISLRGVHAITNPFLVDIYLKPLLPDQIIILKNIFFDTDQYVLKPESRFELDRLIGFLVRNPYIRIEIRGHTDNVGTKEYNDRLSELRARAVYQYLIDHGIHAGRLEYHGYGFSVPLASNETEGGRSMNRRTEFRILENR
jgi:outer membrane protein OmpA-like peptidoglycan-associated protein